jgi:hypothetical protein
MRTASHQWFTHVILVTLEEVIRRIEVQGQPRQVVHEILSQKYQTHTHTHTHTHTQTHTHTRLAE